jgi:Rps23 Pro-64 3,4-dihydroxylase Tpa1-like proline 4-hydroxylase
VDEAAQHSAGAQPGLGHMPPHHVQPDALPKTLAAELLDYTIRHETSFVPARVGRGTLQQVDAARRVAAVMADLGPFAAPLRQMLIERLPEFVARLKVADVERPDVELQLAAHGDGAFFSRHIDTRATPEQRQWLRVVSAVYYFHRLPRRFTGGALRLFAFGRADSGAFIDIEPTHNTLVVFPSWAQHAVEPVQCPSREFAHSRFAINCWYRVPAPAAR